MNTKNTMVLKQCYIISFYCIFSHPCVALFQKSSNYERNTIVFSTEDLSEARIDELGRQDKHDLEALYVQFNNLAPSHCSRRPHHRSLRLPPSRQPAFAQGDFYVHLQFEGWFTKHQNSLFLEQNLLQICFDANSGVLVCLANNELCKRKQYKMNLSTKRSAVILCIWVLNRHFFIFKSKQ